MNLTNPESINLQTAWLFNSLKNAHARCNAMGWTRGDSADITGCSSVAGSLTGQVSKDIHGLLQTDSWELSSDCGGAIVQQSEDISQRQT